MRRLATTLLALAAGVAPAALHAQAPAGPADMVVLGRVWTADAARPWAEAIAVTDSLITYVGDRVGARRFIGAATRVMDNGVDLVTPGFGDAHTHFLSGGFQLASVDLRDAATPEEFIRRLAAFARGLPAGQWITGGDWDHERWAGSPLPRREWIDSVTPGNPVFVSRLDGHMGVANSLALRRAGIDRATPTPPGGMIVHDSATGDVTGVLKDNAMDRMYGAIPAPSEAQADTALQRAMRHAASLGVTTIHTMTDWSEWAAFRRARAHGAMVTRARVFVPLASWRRLADTVRALGRGDAWLGWGGLKGFMDGSLGSTTAAFFEPYRDAPATRGLLVADSAVLQRDVVGADSAGLQVAVHAIGDRANAMLLGFFESAVRRNGTRDRRFRVEHAQHLRQADIARFGQLGVIPSMQPYHAIDDGRWAERKIGPERVKTTYAFESLRRSGARLAFGSDWTVAPLDPVLGIYAAVTRRTVDGKNPGGWVPGEKVAVEEAVRAYTVNGAWTQFAEGLKGTVEAGKLADLVVLDRDIFTIPPEEIGEAKVRLTVFDGKIVFGGGR
jgi:hypothetical protein